MSLGSVLGLCLSLGLDVCLGVSRACSLLGSGHGARVLIQVRVGCGFWSGFWHKPCFGSESMSKPGLSLDECLV